MVTVIVLSIYKPHGPELHSYNSIFLLYSMSISTLPEMWRADVCKSEPCVFKYNHCLNAPSILFHFLFLISRFPFSFQKQLYLYLFYSHWYIISIGESVLVLNPTTIVSINILNVHTLLRNSILRNLLYRNIVKCTKICRRVFFPWYFW